MIISFKQDEEVMAAIFIKTHLVVIFDDVSDIESYFSPSLSEEEFIITAKTWLLLNGFDYEQYEEISG